MNFKAIITLIILITISSSSLMIEISRASFINQTILKNEIDSKLTIRKRTACSFQFSNIFDLIKMLTNPLDFVKGADHLIDFANGMFDDSASNCDIKDKLDSLTHNMNDLKALIKCDKSERNLDALHLQLHTLEAVLLAYQNSNYKKSEIDSVINHCKETSFNPICNDSE
jgi:hypothetical protein